MALRFRFSRSRSAADVDTTNGAEASHERSSKPIANYHRGYEWWLMQQAKVRNPNIKLYGLQWGTPGWVNGTYATAYNWYSTNDIPYVVDWLKNAQSVYGLTIDYIGGQNEGDSVGYAPYFEALKAAITAAGLGPRSSPRTLGTIGVWRRP